MTANNAALAAIPTASDRAKSAESAGRARTARHDFDTLTGGAAPACRR